MTTHRTRRATLLVGWATLSLVALCVLAFPVLSYTHTVIVDDYICAMAPAAGAVACLRAARRGGRSTRAWLLLGLSLLSWAAAGAIWTVYEVHLGRVVPFPGVTDVGYLASVPLAVAALLSFPGSRLVGMSRLRPLVDGAIAAGSLLFVSWTLLLGPSLRVAEGSAISQAVALAYPVCDVIMATMALLALAWARGNQRTTMLLVAVGLILLAIADSGFAYLTLRGNYDLAIFDTGYVAGFLLIGVAALLSDPSADDTDKDSIDNAVLTSRITLALPYAPLIVSLPLAATTRLRGEILDTFELGISVFVIIAILLRQLMSMQVITALSGELAASVETLRKREVELQHQAFHDPLTGLANRALFADRTTHALTRTRRPGPVTLLLADLDDFKTVNDTLGHAAGDTLLVTVAARLLAVVRPQDTVARLGGDEFAVLLETADDLEDARAVAERISQALKQPFYLAGVHTVVGASIGITTADASATAEGMLRDADIAMYAAKAGGKGRFAVYAEDFAAENLDRLQLKGDLSQALSRGQFSVKYLPVVDLDSGRMTSVEALLRWYHPTRGSVPRSVFVPLAEASGDIIGIGRWVFEQVCAQAGQWQQERTPGSEPLRVSVNVSGRQLGDPALASSLQAALTKADFPPQRLTVELTESVTLDSDATRDQLAALKELGVAVAIDDLGTGHAALTRLRQYPINTLKIDESCVRALAPEATAPDVLVAAILSVGRGLGMRVVAEGVETESQLAALRALGCRYAQGFLFARPAEPEVISELIRSGITLTDPVSAPAA